MSCVLRISAAQLAERLPLTAVKPYRVENGTAHFDVSGRDFDDLPGQVNDAIAFLRSNATDLKLLLSAVGAEGVLDFAVEASADTFQFAAFSASLVREASGLGLGLELSYYPLGKNRAGA
jgi:hypothetical protein